jgi:glycogen debranching enzyme
MKRFWHKDEVGYKEPMSGESLWQLGEKSIRELEVELGILASSRQEVFGCVFGRDSLITSLSLLRVYERSKDPYYIALVRKILINLANLQGKEWNIESGEEPGKIIHEYRTEKHEHLTAAGVRPWYLYPDNVMRNYDTVDATPLFLMAAFEYVRITNDTEFLQLVTPAIDRALTWVMEFGDTDGDGLIDYNFKDERTYGGLLTQSWMDSNESLFFERSDNRPLYPIAPVEVQAYSYAALLGWAEQYKESDREFSETLSNRAMVLKKAFNEKFVLRYRGITTLAFALDGLGRPLTSPRSSMGHCLWAVHRDKLGVVRSILDGEHIAQVVHRLMRSDLFVRRAGIRTLSSHSNNFDPMSYHNGSIWPHDTAIVADGFANFGFIEEAKQVRTALLRAYAHFETPIELFAFSGRTYHEYTHANGAGACRIQAWSAASLLTTIAYERKM